MTGTWLIRIGNWVARKDTFDRIVAPAIADLQVEASLGFVQRWRHYFAIAAVLTLALLTDLRTDVLSAFDSSARLAWRRAAIWYAGFAAVFTVVGIRYSVPDMPKDGVWSAVLTHAAFEAAITAVPVAIAPAALYLSRRSSSGRSVVLAAMIVAALTVGSAMAVRPLRMSADQTLSNRIHSLNTGRAGEYWDKSYLDENVTSWLDIQSGASVLPYAVIGVVLSRRRGWRIASTIGQFMATWVLLVAFVVLRMDDTPSLVFQRWRDIGLLTMVSLIWLTADWLYKFTTRGLRSRDA
jgi:hypothetical protein